MWNRERVVESFLVKRSDYGYVGDKLFRKFFLRPSFRSFTNASVWNRQGAVICQANAQLFRSVRMTNVRPCYRANRRTWDSWRLQRSGRDSYKFCLVHSWRRLHCYVFKLSRCLQTLQLRANSSHKTQLWCIFVDCCICRDVPPVDKYQEWRTCDTHVQSGKRDE